MRSPYSHAELCRRLARQARPYAAHVIAFLAISLLAAPLALLTPVPLKIAVDTLIEGAPLPPFVALLLPDAVGQSDAALLLLVTALVIVVAVLNQVQDVAATLLRTYTAERLLLDFRAALFRHVQRLSLRFHDARGSADSLYRLQYDTAAVPAIAIETAIPFVSAVVTLVAMIYVTARVDWQLALVALAFSPPLALASGAFGLRLRSRAREVKKLESSALGVVHEVLGAVRLVTAFGQEDREQQRFRSRSAAGMRARLELALLDGGYGMVVTILLAAGTAATLYVGILHVRAGTLTLGNLLLVMSYIAQMYAPLKSMSKKASTLQTQIASAERAFALLDETPDVCESAHARPIARTAGRIEFRHVTFGYESGRPVLADASFAIAPGSSVGLVGRTGSGKTTLVSLIMRFYDPLEGAVLLDSVDLRDYRLADLRNQFALVLQEPVLFSTTIAENIAYARPNATPQEIEAAARDADAHAFISSLPEGYDTLVGERGMRLSGGERQRISIARAFLKDAPILILDEPTSSVDINTEATIVGAIDRLMRRRTTLMISHRPSTLRDCDLLVHVEGGRVVSRPAAMLAGLARVAGDLQ